MRTNSPKPSFDKPRNAQAGPVLDNARLHKKIWGLAWPMILANVATTLIGIVDTAILGHLPNPAFIGGAAVATSLFNILYMSLAFFRMGTTGLIAQHYGEKHWQNLYTTLALSSLIALLIGSAVVLCRFSIVETSIPLIGGSDQVQSMAHIYANIRILSSPFVLFNFVAVGFLIGIQKSRQALYLLMFSQGINIFLDFYLAIYLKWDIHGIAWATVVSDVSGSILATYFMWSFLKPRVSHWLTFLQIKEKLNIIFSLNRDIFFRTIVLISIFAFITAQSARQGDIILAANAILIQLFLFLANAIDGFANAAESRTGEFIGEYHKDNRDESIQEKLASTSISTATSNTLETRLLNNLRSMIQSNFNVALSQAFIFLIAVLCIVIFYGDVLLSLISNQTVIVTSAQNYLIWLPILMLCSIVCFVLDGVLIGATKGRTMLIAILSSTVLVFFPSWYFLQDMANHGIWLALCLFMLCRSGLTYVLFLKLRLP